ncbi:MAG: hypothetical protein OJF50_003252 [Nitrospira sp.]|nr:hypothetical protein [Nitrospira sp.]
MTYFYIEIKTYQPASPEPTGGVIPLPPTRHIGARLMR